MPVVATARWLDIDEEKMLRAVTLSNLIAIRIKAKFGRLSNLCGATVAATGAACGIAYLDGAKPEMITKTIVNTLGICSGMVCDGAKSSCAAKIASAVDAGLMGYNMYLNGGHQFVDGEGIIKKGVENTIVNVGRLARQGMRRTDEEILDIMVGR